MNEPTQPSAAELAALIDLPGACWCRHAPEAHGSDGCRWHHIAGGEPCGCLHFIEASGSNRRVAAHPVVVAFGGDPHANCRACPKCNGCTACGYCECPNRPAATHASPATVALVRSMLAPIFAAADSAVGIAEAMLEQHANETHVDTSDPSAAIDASRPSEPRIEVRANGRALVLTVDEAHRLREQLDAALAPMRYPHGRGCQCPVCE